MTLRRSSVSHALKSPYEGLSRWDVAVSTFNAPVGKWEAESLQNFHERVRFSPGAPIFKGMLLWKGII